MLTPALIRGARAMLQMSQADLAEKAGMSKTGLANIETGSADARATTLAAVQRSLEAAGAEFIDEAGGMSVRIRKGIVSMTLKEILDRLRLYEHSRLRTLGVIDNQGRTKLGFAFVYQDNDRVSLMLEGAHLGQARWGDGRIEFDPPITRTNLAHSFEDDLDQWASRAYARSLTGG